jgi:hypothetical protein
MATPNELRDRIKTLRAEVDSYSNAAVLGPDKFQVGNSTFTRAEIEKKVKELNKTIKSLEKIVAPFVKAETEYNNAQAALARAREIAANPIVESATGIRPEQARADVVAAEKKVASAKTVFDAESTKSVDVAAPMTVRGVEEAQKGFMGPQGGRTVGATTATATAGPASAVTGTARGSARSTTVKSTTPPKKKMSWDAVSAKFRELFPSQSWLLDIDPAKYADVQGVIRSAVEQNETPERFAEKFQNTSFYKELATTGKRRQVVALVGDVGFDSKSLNSFLVTAMNLGWEGDTLRAETYKEVFRKDDAGNLVNPTAVNRVKKSNDYLKIQNVGKAFFNTVADDTVQSVLTGEMSQDDVLRQQRELAKTKYGHLSNLLDQGLSLEAIGDSFKTQAAQLLEKDPNSIDMSQADYEVALNFGEPGQKRLMTNGEWQKLLRTDKRYGWDTTENAKQEARQLAESFRVAFGRTI